MPSGRIIKGVAGIYTVVLGDSEYLCQARGLFRKQGRSPIVGDFAEISITDEEKKTGYLLDIFERKNELIRPKIANVDQAVIVVAAEQPQVNLKLLDEFVIMIEKQKLDIIICINKIDLDENGNYIAVGEVYKNAGYTVVYASAEKTSGLDELRSLFAGKVSVLAGPSGVGKSSLINSVFPNVQMQTGELSKKIARGKHTTRKTEFIPVAENGYLADTPGFTSIFLEHIPLAEFKYLFREFEDYNDKCRFADCSHLAEPDCAVKERLGSGISLSRYENYTNFMKRG